MFGRKMKFSPRPTQGGGGGLCWYTGKKILGGWSGRFSMGHFCIGSKCDPHILALSQEKGPIILHRKISKIFAAKKISEKINREGVIS